MKNKIITLICVITLFFSQYALAQVSINTTGNSPNASAMLDVESDSKGLLIPRLTTVQRTTLATTAVDGLLVFDSEDQSFYVFGNGVWVNLSSSAEIWSQNSMGVFLNNSTMNVGIGTNTPTLKLDVRGESPDNEGVISLSNSDQSHMLRIAGGRFTYPDPYIQWKEGDNLRFVTDQGGWSEKMRITTWGSIGIGTGQPATYTKFHVLQSGSTLASQFMGTVACFQSNGGTDYWSRVSIIGGNLGASVLDLGDVDNQASGNLIYDHTDNFMSFTTDNNEKMRISSNGIVGIGTNTPDASSMLDITSSDKGILIPHVILTTTDNASPVTAPATGLLIYNTATAGTGYTAVSPGFYFWNGTLWNRFSGAGEAWETSGNSASVSGTHFLGTTDNQALDIRTNNVTKVRFTTQGQIEILNTGGSVFIEENAGANDDLNYHENIFIGLYSGNSNTIGKENTATGGFSLMNNVSGVRNTAIGYSSLYSNTSGIFNTAIGAFSLNSNTTGHHNTVTGCSPLFYNTTASHNIAIGFRALLTQSFDNGGTPWNSWNIAIGDSALFSNQPTSTSNGIYNTAIGHSSLFSNTTGWSNTATGFQSLYSNTSGAYNTAIGFETLSSNTTGSKNIAFGFRALLNNTTANGNIAIGNATLSTQSYNNGGTPWNSFNIAIGDYALYSNNPTTTTSGFYNIAVGHGSLFSNTTGYFNTATGFESLNSNTTGSFNTATGHRTLTSNTTGHYNTAIGNLSLFNNTSGTYNTAIGYNAFYSGSLYSNSTAIGYNSSPGASNTVRLGNNSVSTIGGYANWTNVSDSRFKTNVKENVIGIDFIMKLRPVTYNLDMDAVAGFNKTPDSLRLFDGEKLKEAEVQIGFIAQEVEKAADELGFDFHGIDKPKNENSHYGLRYAEFVVPLIKAVQEQQELINNLEIKNDDQDKLIQELLKRIEKLESE